MPEDPYIPDRPREIPRERFDLTIVRGSIDHWPAPRKDERGPEHTHPPVTPDDTEGPFG